MLKEIINKEYLSQFSKAKADTLILQFYYPWTQLELHVNAKYNDMFILDLFFF